VQTGLLREEQIRAFHNVLEVRFAVSVDQRSHIGDVDSFRTTSVNISDRQGAQSR